MRYGKRLGLACRSCGNGNAFSVKPDDQVGRGNTSEKNVRYMRKNVFHISIERCIRDILKYSLKQSVPQPFDAFMRGYIYHTDGMSYPHNTGNILRAGAFAIFLAGTVYKGGKRRPFFYIQRTDSFWCIHLMTGKRQ